MKSLSVLYPGVGLEQMRFYSIEYDFTNITMSNYDIDPIYLLLKKIHILSHKNQKNKY